MANNTTIIENEGFSVKVQIEKDSVLVVINDKDRDTLSEMSGISAISIFKNDNFIRVATDHKIRKI